MAVWCSGAMAGAGVDRSTLATVRNGRKRVRRRGGGRYVSAVAADGDARNADDLQMPSAPPRTPAASYVLAYLKPSVPPLFDISPPILTLTNFKDDM